VYMTRVILKNVPQPETIHSLLLAAFPGENSDKTHERLWRVDKLEEHTELLVVSINTPELQHIAQEDARNKTLNYTPLLARLANGQEWNFRLCANPVEHKKKNTSDKRVKVYALRSAAEQLEWLNKQSSKHGFHVKECAVLHEEWRTNTNDKTNTTRILAVTFEGCLAITDAEAFREALIHGIGGGKTLGCGLLSVAREIP